MPESRTLALIKPHAVKNGDTLSIRERYELAGLKITHTRFFTFTPKLAAEFYSEHKGKPFFSELVFAMCEGKTEAVVLSGEGDTVSLVRELNGATKPSEAAKGTIRHDFEGSDGPRNVVHGSDSVTAAAREIALIFGSDV